MMRKGFLCIHISDCRGIESSLTTDAKASLYIALRSIFFHLVSGRLLTLLPWRNVPFSGFTNDINSDVSVSMEASADPSLANEYDVIVVGAGISGINAAYRLQTETPNHSFAILESREAIGGTWDLFRYPGIRSDSDLHTFGYPWRPWNEEKEIADGASILNYIKASARQYGLDKKVKFSHKLLATDWKSEDLRWHLTVDVRGTEQIFKARFIILSTGYYDYDSPLETVIPGLDSFMGQVVHPVRKLRLR
jgi:hypothetical protein